MTHTYLFSYFSYQRTPKYETTERGLVAMVGSGSVVLLRLVQRGGEWRRPRVCRSETAILVALTITSFVIASLAVYIEATLALRS